MPEFGSSWAVLPLCEQRRWAPCTHARMASSLRAAENATAAGFTTGVSWTMQFLAFNSFDCRLVDYDAPRTQHKHAVTKRVHVPLTAAGKVPATITDQYRRSPQLLMFPWKLQRVSGSEGYAGHSPTESTSSTGSLTPSVSWEITCPVLKATYETSGALTPHLLPCGHTISSQALYSVCSRPPQP